MRQSDIPLDRNLPSSSRTMVNATNANIVTHNATDDQRTTKECQKHPRPWLLVVNYIKYDLIVFSSNFGLNSGLKLTLLPRYRLK